MSLLDRLLGRQAVRDERTDRELEQLAKEHRETLRRKEAAIEELRRLEQNARGGH